MAKRKNIFKIHPNLRFLSIIFLSLAVIFGVAWYVNAYSERSSAQAFPTPPQGLPPSPPKTPTPAGSSVRPDCYQLIYRTCEGTLWPIGKRGTGNIGGSICRSGSWTVVKSNGPPACSSGVATVDVICGNLNSCPNYYSTRTPTPPYGTNCFDSDGGRNYYVFGKTLYKNKTYVDSCGTSTSNKNLLREYYCTPANSLGNTSYTCPGSCRNGACTK